MTRLTGQRIEVTVRCIPTPARSIRAIELLHNEALEMMTMRPGRIVAVYLVGEEDDVAKNKETLRLVASELGITTVAVHCG